MYSHLHSCQGQRCYFMLIGLRHLFFCVCRMRVFFCLWHYLNLNHLAHAQSATVCIVGSKHTFQLFIYITVPSSQAVYINFLPGFNSTLCRACNLTSFSPCLTGPVDYPFASRHKGLRFKSPVGYFCETGILLFALSCYNLFNVLKGTTACVRFLPLLHGLLILICIVVQTSYYF